MAQRLDSAGAVAFSPDGRYLAAAGGHDQTIWAWRLADGAEAGHIKLDCCSISALAFSPDNRLLYVAGGGPGLGLFSAFNLADGRLVREFKGHKSAVHEMYLSPDGGRMLTSSFYEKIYAAWDTATGRQLWQMKGEGESDYHAALRPDGKEAAIKLATSTLALVNPESGAVSKRIPLAGSIDRIAYTRDGKIVTLLRGRAPLFVLVDPQSGSLKPQATFDGDNYTNVFALSPDGSTATLNADSGETLLRVDVAGAKPAQTMPLTLARFPAKLGGLAFSPDGELFAAAGGRKAVHLFDARTWEPRPLHEGHTERITSVFFPDASTLRTVGGEQTVCDWNLSTLRLKAQRPLPPDCLLLALDPAGTHALCQPRSDRRTLFYPTALQIIERESGRTIAEMSIAGGYDTHSAQWPSGKYAYLSGPDGVTVIEPLRGATIRTLPKEDAFGSRMLATEGQLYLFSGLPTKMAHNLSLTAISPPSGSQQRSGPMAEALWIDEIGAVPDGKHFWLATRDRGVWFVRRDTLAPVLHLDALTRHVSFDSKARTFVLVDQRDQLEPAAVRVYDWPSGHERERMMSADFRHAQALFTPDDQRLLVARQEGILEIYDRGNPTPD